ncbi:MAG TPA: ABC transporter ATP-binding protein [Clostridiaceae bacterium]|nr:ABC transporter ATP-binding protein [Clostridiaceae bacterium]
MTDFSATNTQTKVLTQDNSLKSNQNTTNKKQDIVIKVNDLKKVYRVGKQPVFALNGVSFEIERGEFCSIVGTSGSGKSTLLNLLAGLEPPSKGSIFVNNLPIVGLSEKKLVDFRRDQVGFIFQSFNLIQTMTAWENVALPLIFRGTPISKRKKIAIRILHKLGLKTHIYHKPNELSGGQQQRVGIARALVVNPAIVFADEPTGNLDSATSAEIMQLIQQISRENNQTLIMVTHDEHLAQYADRIFRISDGKIIGIEKGSKNYE